METSTLGTGKEKLGDKMSRYDKLIFRRDCSECDGKNLSFIDPGDELPYIGATVECNSCNIRFVADWDIEEGEKATLYNMTLGLYTPNHEPSLDDMRENMKAYDEAEEMADDD